MAEVLIVPYDSEYKEDLKRLSYEWLEKYVSVEPEDERIINNPEEVVLGCSSVTEKLPIVEYCFKVKHRDSLSELIHKVILLLNKCKCLLIDIHLLTNPHSLVFLLT
ncbi:hypothetical protein [Lysinibacillus sp. JNUCC 51]|uniref:hypothetical protein n=1 Tax=Lysinibacillus sp. JNUCC-51 TaxID=2792479 RepID=UPI0019381660|nr:hypothetical protein JNUCC51_23380 [Lysinibacillus sp. JNUCC-51]